MSVGGRDGTGGGGREGYSWRIRASRDLATAICASVPGQSAHHLGSLGRTTQTQLRAPPRLTGQNCSGALSCQLSCKSVELNAPLKHAKAPPSPPLPFIPSHTRAAQYTALTPSHCHCGRGGRAVSTPTLVMRALTMFLPPRVSLRGEPPQRTTPRRMLGGCLVRLLDPNCFQGTCGTLAQQRWNESYFLGEK